MMLAPTLRYGGAWALAGICFATALSNAASAQDLEDLNQELSEIEGDLAALRAVTLESEAVRSPTYVEERLTDGELYFGLRDYVRASIIFTDLVENYPNHRAFPDALFLLGESLYAAGDYLGAKNRFRQLIDQGNRPGFSSHVQSALGRLIEIAISLRDFDGVDSYFTQLSSAPSTEAAATAAYYRAKYLYARAVPNQLEIDQGAVVNQPMIDEAIQRFNEVPEGTIFYPQARYFIGVIHTLRGEYPQAIDAFRRVLRSEGESQEAIDVIDLTHLALGRLYYETDQLDQAVEAYQAVPRTSPRFDDALYEIAWVYIRMGDSTHAERALEVLSVATPDSVHIPDGKILRGNLLLRDGRFDDARAVFREVRDEFGPVYRELEEIREAHSADLQGYFRQLVRENMETFDAANFLPANAARWTDLDEDLERSLNVLSDLAECRNLVRETQDLIVRLNAAISAPNRASIFADLRMQREGTTALLNRATQVRRGLIRLDERSGGGNAATVRAQRREIEAQLAGLPENEDDFIERDNELTSRYRRLERELSDLEVELYGMEARIVATETFVDQSAAQLEGADAIRNEVQAQRDAIAAYREQIVELEQLVEIGQIQVGVGDARYDRDASLRAEYARLVEQERNLIGNTATASAHQRLAQIEAAIRRRDDEIDSRVDGRVSNMRQVIEEESANLQLYRQEIQDLEGETEVVVGAVTADAFIDVRDRFYDLVLRADVGRVDIAWAEREEHRMRADMLLRDRARELQALDDEFRDIMDEGDAQEENQ